MTYDWKSKRDRARLGQGGRGGGGGLVIKTRSPKGFLLLNRGVQNVIESLSYFEQEERELVYDVLMWIRALDEDTPILTAQNRRFIMLYTSDNSYDQEPSIAQPAAVVDGQLRFTDVTEGE